MEIIKIQRSKVFTFSVLILLFVSCRNGLERRVHDIYDECEKNKVDKCIVELNEITWFEWDTFYIVSEAVEQEKFIEITGLNNFEKDHQRVLLFKHNGDVKYLQEDFPGFREQYYLWFSQNTPMIILDGSKKFYLSKTSFGYFLDFVE